MHSFRDRTDHFHRKAERIAREKPANWKGGGSTRQQPGKSPFHVAASQISKGIHHTANKLAKLSKLAKKKSLFDDPSLEIQELTYIVKQDITNLNKQIEELKAFQLNGGRKSKNDEEHGQKVVGTLQSRLLDTKSQFEDFWNTRTENLKEQQKSRAQFTHENKQGSFGQQPRYLQPDPFRSERGQQSSEGVSIDMSMQTMEQVNYTASRVDAVQSIESTIVELQGIFGQLATMVQEQGEMVERIDSNVDESVLHVNAAQNELLRYYQSISSNRGLIVKVFLVLLVTIGAFLFLFT
eukprot:TRINITY_DN9371_c0_g1_i1.p1 TRINITY_DN9371_c0_g1~~TRINITY_DN9371_c0_g1_i1.p1  ORF type:complete len:295 (+),score=77.71 TRINITY_DN9371_c0_g1_i1:261-1145(+)